MGRKSDIFRLTTVLVNPWQSAKQNPFLSHFNPILYRSQITKHSEQKNEVKTLKLS